MGVYQIKHLNNDSIIGFWKITESTEQLLLQYLAHASFRDARERAEFQCFKSESRKKEWLCCRLLVREMLGDHTIMVKYNEHRAPSLVGSPLNVSFSHTKGLVAVIVGTCAQLGIDIEQKTDRIADLALKFLNIQEHNAIDRENKILHLYLHWCGKETMFKVSSNKTLDFRENLYIEPFEVRQEGSFRGNVLYDGTKSMLVLHYLLFEDYIVVWCCQ